MAARSACRQFVNLKNQPQFFQRAKPLLPSVRLGRTAAFQLQITDYPITNLSVSLCYT
jgi:hypothetical protein